MIGKSDHWKSQAALWKPTSDVAPIEKIETSASFETKVERQFKNSLS